VSELEGGDELSGLLAQSRGRPARAWPGSTPSSSTLVSESPLEWSSSQQSTASASASERMLNQSQSQLLRRQAATPAATERDTAAKGAQQSGIPIPVARGEWPGGAWQHQLQRQQQQVPAANMRAPATRGPLLANDQEYYLAVASASALTQSAHPQAQANCPFPPAEFAVHQHQAALAAAAAAVAATTEESEDFDDYAVPSDESCRLDRSQVELVQIIGEGQRGFVFLGKLQSKDGRQISDVAIKTLKYETDQLIERLMREAAMMRQFEHPHIIKFIGVCPETPALIAMELAEFGEIKQYLKQNKHLISVSTLVLFTFQISTALSYLESKQFVHRDVAARNVLVCAHNCVKLADFGLSRNLQAQTVGQQQRWLASKLSCGASGAERLLVDAADRSHYVAESQGKLPVRWLAPESLAFRRFTSSSDVWMFAVCSWELFHLCQLRPWANIRNNQVLLAIEAGQRLARPPSCPVRLYQLLLQCWSYAPVQRPKFRELKQSLWSIYLNERALEQMEVGQLRQRQQRALALEQQQRLALIAQDNFNCVQPTPTSQPQANWRPEHLAAPHPMVLSSSPLMANYASNVSGYSSATADHSNNSSRSSSISSPARQQAMALRGRPIGVASSEAFVSSNQPALAEFKLEQQQLEEAAAARDRRQREKIADNMGRFQRSPGSVLQKQRSQSSITSNANKGLQVPLVRSGQFGLDDAVLLGGGQKRAAWQSGCQSSAGRLDFELGEEEDSSETEGGQLVRRFADMSCEPANRLRPVEPTYEGIPEARLPNSGGQPSPFMIERAHEAAIKPSSAGHERRQRAAEVARRERKIASVLESMKVLPLKARLADSQGLLQASAGHQAAASSSRAQRHRQQNEQVGVKQTRKAEEGGEQVCEEQRQLAVHQRLLGHIRSAASRSQRASKNLHELAAPSGEQATKAASVDQSLEILESLISERAPVCGGSKAARSGQPTGSEQNSGRQLAAGARHLLASNRARK